MVALAGHLLPTLLFLMRIAQGLRFILELTWEIYFMAVKLAFWACNHRTLRLSAEAPTNSFRRRSLQLKLDELIRTGKVWSSIHGCPLADFPGAR